MSGEGKSGYVERAAKEGEQTATGMQKETFGEGTAAQSAAGKQGGERAKEMGAGIMADPSGYGKKGGESRGSGDQE
ncbi:mitogen-activated kinase [Chlorella sorokiniana]|uniref:Mitogen-activated kinase n=1 Tax=Chlorella sorokiniana TaxID=3076 RepID=A0A2P6TXF3_CHLSO|nr:mitogen-activated kinase [Chlorella sorokiniana]|eukprot:PRW58745.1 mitogen-activated kinase [Chlorella sorokiniana]